MQAQSQQETSCSLAALTMAACHKYARCSSIDVLSAGLFRAVSWRASMLAPQSTVSQQALLRSLSEPDASCNLPSAESRSGSPVSRAGSRLTTNSPAPAISKIKAQHLCIYVTPLVLCCNALLYCLDCLQHGCQLPGNVSAFSPPALPEYACGRKNMVACMLLYLYVLNMPIQMLLIAHKAWHSRCQTVTELQHSTTLPWRNCAVFALRSHHFMAAVMPLHVDCKTITSNPPEIVASRGMSDA